MDPDDTLFEDLGDEPLVALPFSWDALEIETCDPGGYRSISRSADWRAVREDGRVITLGALHQGLTYAGTLCGLPLDDEVKAWPVRSAVARATEMFGVERTRVCILPPRMLRSRVTRLRHGHASDLLVDFLPPVCSIGEFQCAQPVRDADAAGSAVVVVWFQKSFGPPEPGHVTEAVRGIDWRPFAKDSSW